MKVSMMENYKDILTVSQAQQARAVIACEKDDTMTAKEYADMAIRSAVMLRDVFSWDILKVEATAQPHPSIEWDRVCEGSGLMDVSIVITAKYPKGYLEIYTWLTELWETCTGEGIYPDCSVVRYHRATTI